MSLNKKFTNIFKIILIIIFVIIAIWVLMLSVDFYRCTHRKSPIFARMGVLNDDIMSYDGIFYRIEQKWKTTPSGDVITLVIEDRFFLFNKRIY